ncbi:DoxX family protein [Tianweitania sediminis]|uniref:DoxX family protein n=1 Tax=Tianweitania sediminis TaxID=1502156 RepID=A0A8J7UII8_9HYPH|nr:DoxX family protein [Tianweitania sediminis]MBP0437699.1 DoxX family protein [Tianweitania sediminis]
MERDFVMNPAATANVQRGSHLRWLGLWTLRIVLGLAFVVFALMKFSGREAMVLEFDAVGLGQWFRYFTATLEMIAGIAIIIPRTSVFGALLALAVDLGAFIAQLTLLHIDWIHTVVIAALLMLTVYLQRAQLGWMRSRIGRANTSQAEGNR